MDGIPLEGEGTTNHRKTQVRQRQVRLTLTVTVARADTALTSLLGLDLDARFLLTEGAM